MKRAEKSKRATGRVSRSDPKQRGPIAKAVRSLRESMGNATQQVLASKLGLSITAVARYEIGLREPERAILFQLAELAVQANRPDLADTFTAQLMRDVPLYVRPRSVEDSAILLAVQQLLSDPRYKDRVDALLEVLRPVIRDIQEQIAKDPDRMVVHLGEFTFGPIERRSHERNDNEASDEER